MEAALGNKVVLRHIFSFLSFSDLKHCRLVNRTWNFEAGSYLTDFYRCTARINLCTPCSDLLTLNDLARQSAILATNSLRISFCSQIIHRSCNYSGSKRGIYAELLEKLSLKHLYISWATDYEPDDCPAIQFVMNIFLGKLMELRTLEFEDLSQSFQRCYKSNTNEDRSFFFPKLKEMDLGYMRWWPHDEFLLKIFEGSPKLSKLKGHFDGYMRVIPEDKYFILDSFELCIMSTGAETTCLRVAEAKPALSFLTLTNSFESERHQKKESYFFVLEQLLTSSWKTLEKLSVESVQISFSKLAVPPLVFLKKLTLDAGALLQDKLRFLQSIDYPDLMPALAKVKVDGVVQPEHSSNDLEDYGAPVVQLHPSKTVKSLKLRMDVFPLILYRLSEIFPNVSSLNIRPRSIHTESIPYNILWMCWPHLECIDLLEGEDAMNCNFDAAFLGVHPEELDILKELDDESLERVNIVPVRPSIMTMKCLKLVRIHFQWYGSEYEKEYPEELFLSKITGICALRKLAKVGVSIELTSPCEGHADTINLSHLKPFASVSYRYFNEHEYVWTL